MNGVFCKTLVVGVCLVMLAPLPGRGAGLIEAGDELAASVFEGTVNTNDGNPNAEGQGWYRKDLAIQLNYYTVPVPKWATIETAPPTEVTNLGARIFIKDAYSGGVGTAWVYSNQVVGRYVLSFTNCSGDVRFLSQILVKTNAGSPWLTVSQVFTGTVAAAASVTNTLGRDGRLAFRMWNSKNTAANSGGSVSGLKVALFERATNTPSVTLSASAAELPENPLHGTAWVTARLSELSVSNVTVNLLFTGTAVRDVDYAAGSGQLVILAGDASATTTLTGLDDGVPEGNETLTVGIESVVNANPGGTDLALTLTDDDAAAAAAGDVVAASLILGFATNTVAGNPNPSGQGWYRRDLSTLLNYYTNETSRWGTSVAKPTGTYVTYSEVSNAADRFYIRDAYNGASGVAWIYSNSAVARYVISCTNVTGDSHFLSQFMVKTNGESGWLPLSGVTTGNLAGGAAYTNSLGRDGRLALAMWNNISMVTESKGSVAGLKVTLEELATNTPSVSLSASSGFLPENPLHGNAVVTANLSELSVSNVTVTLRFGGTAVLDQDYAAGVSQIMIPAGYASGTCTVTALDDVLSEGDESFSVAIESLDNAVAGSPSEVGLTLSDDEKSPAGKGDCVLASIFLGSSQGTSGGNPNASGQGWFRKDLVTPLNYYTAPAPKWSTSDDTASPNYSEVTPFASNRFKLKDNYYGGLGIGWVYTNGLAGRYVISCTNIGDANPHLLTEFLVQTNAGGAWVSLSGVMTGNVARGYSSTNWLERGSRLAFKAWNDILAAAYVTATISDLKVTLIEGRTRGTILIIR